MLDNVCVDMTGYVDSTSLRWWACGKDGMVAQVHISVNMKNWLCTSVWGGHIKESHANIYFV